MRKTNTIRQIALNTLTGWTAVLTRAGLAIVMVPFLLGHLGKEGYGFIGLLGVIVSLSAVADLGLRGALGRELAEFVAKRDERGFNELCSTALALYLTIALLLAAAGWILAPWFANVFNIPENLQADAILLIRVYGSLSIIASFISPVFSAALSSHHRFDIINNVQMAGSILSSLVLFAAVSWAGNPLYAWTAVTLSFQWILLVAMYALYRRLCPHGGISTALLRKKRLIPLFKLGGVMYALQLTRTLSEKSDPLIISYFFGPAGVALYQPSGKLSQLIQPIVLTLANQLHPLTTRHHVEQRHDKLKRILLEGTKYTLLLGIFPCAALLVLATPFCSIWLGRALGEDYRIAAQVMMGWAAADILAYAAGTQWAVLLGMKRLRFLLWTHLPGAVLNVLISVYLVGYTPLGIPGVLVATILINLIRRPLLIWHTARQCALPAAYYFRQAYLRPFLIFVVLLLCGGGMRWLMPAYTLTGLIAIGTSLFAIWIAFTWSIGLSRRERAQFLLLLKHHSTQKKPHIAISS